MWREITSKTFKNHLLADYFEPMLFCQRGGSLCAPASAALFVRNLRHLVAPQTQGHPCWSDLLRAFTGQTTSPLRLLLCDSVKRCKWNGWLDWILHHLQSWWLASICHASSTRVRLIRSIVLSTWIHVITYSNPWQYPKSSQIYLVRRWGTHLSRSLK